MCDCSANERESYENIECDMLCIWYGKYASSSFSFIACHFVFASSSPHNMLPSDELLNAFDLRFVCIFV